jgi:hypothetical protein
MADDLTIEDAMYELALFHRQGALSLDSLTKVLFLPFLFFFFSSSRERRREGEY